MKQRAAPRAEFWVVLPLIVLAALPAHGQRVYFNPALSAWGYYTHDVDVGEAQSSDFSYRLQADLPLRVELERGTFELGLTPFVERYDRTDDFDHEGYRGRVSLAVEPNALTALEVAARGYRLRSLDPVPSLEEPESFLIPALERQLEAADFSFRRTTTGRWSWDLRLGYAQWSFDTAGATAEMEPIVPEGRDELSGEVGLYRGVSARTTLGLRYGRRRFSLDRGGRETVDLIALFWSRQLSRSWELEVLAGAYERDGQLSDGTDLTGSGPQGTATFRRTLRTTEVAVRAGSVLTSGGELPGTAELRLVEVSLGNREPLPASWHLLGRWARRVASSPGVPTIDLVTLGGGGELELHRVVGLRLQGFYTEQSGDAVLEESYYGVGAAVVVYPLGRTRLGGGEEGGTEDEG